MSKKHEDPRADADGLIRLSKKEYERELEHLQSNHEGVLVDWLQEAFERDAAVVINVGTGDNSVRISGAGNTAGAGWAESGKAHAASKALHTARRSNEIAMTSKPEGVDGKRRK